MITNLYQGRVLLIWRDAHTYVHFLVHYIKKSVVKNVSDELGRHAGYEGVNSDVWRLQPMWKEKTDIKLLDKLIKIGMKGPDNQPDIL